MDEMKAEATRDEKNRLPPLNWSVNMTKKVFFFFFLTRPSNFSGSSCRNWSPAAVQLLLEAYVADVLTWEHRQVDFL